MHPNPAFRQSPASRNLAFAHDRGFGVLAVNAPAGPLLSHVPFLLAEDGGAAELHLVRSNPIARALGGPQPAVLAVSGPDVQGTWKLNQNKPGAARLAAADALAASPVGQEQAALARLMRGAGE